MCVAIKAAALVNKYSIGKNITEERKLNLGKLFIEFLQAGFEEERILKQDWDIFQRGKINVRQTDQANSR